MTDALLSPGLGLQSLYMGKVWDMKPETKEKIRQAQLRRYAGNIRLVKCEICNKQIRTTQVRLDDGRGRFCSLACKLKWSEGKHFSKKTEFKKGSGLNENNVLWRGDGVGMVGLHYWVVRRLGKPMTCENCGEVKTSTHGIHWHNTNGEYKRNTKDWQRLCSSCHRKTHLEKSKIGSSSI